MIRYALLLCIALAGCATQSNEVSMKMLENLQGCERHYTVALGVGATGSLVIHCQAAK